MPVVQCPRCQKSLNVKQVPPGGRIKCPGCGNVISLAGAPGAATSGGAAAARPRPATAGAPRPAGGRLLTPEDEGFDFSQIQFPSAGPVAVSSFPTDPYARTAYQGPIPGDPLGEYIGQRPDEFDATAAPKGKPKGTLSPAAIAGILGGVFVFLLLAIIVGTVLTSGGGGETKISGSPASTAEELAAAKQNVPAGYTAVEIAGAVIYMPKGQEGSKNLNTVMEYTSVESEKTQSYYFFGSMPETAEEVDPEKLRKRVAAQLKGGYLGGSPFENPKGYKGIKGRLDQSLFVPDMQVETFHVDGRLFIVGAAPFSMGADTSVQLSVDRGAENEELQTFQDSFTVGPRPAGGLFW